MKTYFHIGYPKAGSSTLQKQFFHQHPEINFLGNYPTANTGLSAEVQPEDINNEELKTLHQQLFMDENMDKKLLDHLTEVIEENTKEEQINVLSNEFATSVFFSYPNVEDKIMRIKKLGVDGVIIVLRNQVELIKSLYREHPFDPKDLIHGKPTNLDEWVIKSEKISFSLLESLKYDEIIKSCRSVFGEKNVIVLIFENIIKRPDLPSKKLSEKLSIDFHTTKDLLQNLKVENRGVSTTYNRVRKFKNAVLGSFPISRFMPNHVFYFIKNKLKHGKKAEYSLKPQTIKYLNSYFKHSNQWVEKEFNLDLKKYHYPPYLSEHA